MILRKIIKSIINKSPNRSQADSQRIRKNAHFVPINTPVFFSVQLTRDGLREGDVDLHDALQGRWRRYVLAALVAEVAAPGSDERADVIGRSGEDVQVEPAVGAVILVIEAELGRIERRVRGEQVVQRQLAGKAVGTHPGGAGGGGSERARSGSQHTA